MAAATSSDLLAQLRLYRLLEPAQLEQVEGKLVSEFAEPKALAKELVKRGWLSAYQLNQISQGRGKSLLLGSYVLVDRLGGGGMGDVFKARNWKMGTTRALKVIRKDRLGDQGALKRFKKEMEAAGRLAHPNIVRAYDADEVEGTLLLVLEYVEGTDLAKLVKVHGPLPIDQACDFIRQAACGLQHAFERGMVHRDIKPHNLLLTMVRGSLSGVGKQSFQADDGATEHGQIKILDMGLARLSQVNEDSGSASSMTQEGAILGTPDYIAPEQARESHTVDIRADLYSLGCTFYFLLTGSVPFPKGSLIQKLTKHQFDEPEAVENVRPEVPEHVGAIVRMLMAKQPEDRFQTPAELIDALADENPVSSETTRTMTRAVANAAAAKAPVSGDSKTKSGDTDPLWSSIVTPQITMKSSEVMSLTSVLVNNVFVKSMLARNTRFWILTGGSVLGLCLLSVIIWLLFGRGRAPVEEADVAKEISPPIIVQPMKVDEGGPKKSTDTVTKAPAPDSDKPVTKVEVAKITPDPKTDNKVKKASLWKTSAAFDAWCQEVALLRADEQVNAVAAELKKRNPGFEGLVAPQIFRDMVISLDLRTDKVLDLSPVRALPRLKRLTVAGSGPGKGKVADLGPLQGMPIVYLNADHTKVADLTPLRKLPLEYLYLAGTPVTDLTPLRNLPLKEIRLDYRPQRDMAILRALPTLEKINDEPLVEFWKKVKK